MTGRTGRGPDGRLRTEFRLWDVATRQQIPVSDELFAAPINAALTALVSLEALALRAVNMPLGQEENFKGIIDLVRMKAVVWDDEALGASFHDEEIPADLLDLAKEYREKMVEAAVELDDEAADGENSVIRAQIENGIFVRMASVHDYIDAIESATGKWTRQKKSEERHPGMVRYRHPDLSSVCRNPFAQLIPLCARRRA